MTHPFAPVPAEAETRPGRVTSAPATSPPTADRDAGGGGAALPHERAPRRSRGRDYAVSIETQRALADDARWEELTLAQRLLLNIAVGEWMDVEGRWWTKRKTWAARAGVTESTIDAALPVFRQLGLIESERYFRPSRAGALGGQGCNTYRLDPALVRKVVSERQARIAERRLRAGSPIDGEGDTVPRSTGRPGSPIDGEPRRIEGVEGVLEGSSSTKERRPARAARVRAAVESVEIEAWPSCRGCGSRSILGYPGDGYCDQCSGRRAGMDEPY